MPGQRGDGGDVHKWQKAVAVAVRVVIAVGEFRTCRGRSPAGRAGRSCRGSVAGA
jgi:hypothetical protein